EDGIRYRNVTGVQTCALQISPPPKNNKSQGHRLNEKTSDNLGTFCVTTLEFAVDTFIAEVGAKPLNAIFHAHAGVMAPAKGCGMIGTEEVNPHGTRINLPGDS